VSTNVTVNLKDFSLSLDALANALKRSNEQVLPYHVASIVKTAMNRTKTVDRAKIDRNTKVRTIRQLGLNTKAIYGDPAATSINLGVRGDYGRVYLRLKPKSGKPRFIKTHDPVFRKNLTSSKTGKPVNIRPDYLNLIQADVNEFKAVLREKTALAKNLPHFGKASWLPILFDLKNIFGIDWMDAPPKSVPGLAKILKATDRNGKTWRNGSARKLSSGESLLIEIENHFPALEKAGLTEKLNGAIVTRKRAIDREMRTGVFDDWEQLQTRYPFMKVLK
jgi:hypothetical protein